MKHVITIAVVALAVAGTGCQSGSVWRPQFSADGNVIAFEDSEYRKLYVADEDEVKPLDTSGNFVLSPDGAWVLVIKRQKHAPDLAYQTGDALFLLEWRSGRNYTMLLPFNIPQNLVREPKGRRPRAVERVRDPALLAKAERARVFFFGDIEIIIGPIWDDYFHWGSAESSSNKWTRLSAEEAKDVLPPLSASRLILALADYSEKESCLIEMPSDGLTALHTIWVRPDGSTVELLRKNDAPLKILAACGGTIIVSIYTCGAMILMPILEPSFDLSTLAFRALLPFNTALFSSVIVWGNALYDLGINADKLKSARDALQQEIEKRSAVSGIPAPTEDKQE